MTMKKGYVRVGQSYNDAAGQLRKVRCKCTGDGLLIDSKQFEQDTNNGTPFKRVDYFNHNELGNVSGICPKCKEYAWYTI